MFRAEFRVEPTGLDVFLPNMTDMAEKWLKLCMGLAYHAYCDA